MNQLILIFLLVSTTAFSDVQEMGEELSENELNKKLISSVKEFEVQETIGGSGQFKECKDKFPFNPNQSEAEKETAAASAVACFKNKIGTGKSAESLGKLSDALALESYGLVNSKNAKELTSYLGDQMYKKLTGVDPREKDARKRLEDMKFGNKKMIDQKVFIQLYKTQLIKNSLFEISRFCFENFRLAKSGADESSFIKHWGDQLGKLESLQLSEVTDTGSKGMGTFTNPTSKEEIYKDIFTGLGANTNKFAIVQEFFSICSSRILPLCKEFKEKVAEKSEGEDSLTSSMTRGANSCLTIDKLQRLRKAISKAQLVADDFKKMDGSTFQIQLNRLQKSPEFYNIHKEKNDLSADNLTNHASTDLLQATVIDDERVKKTQDECITNPNGEDCDKFVIIDDSRQKLEQSVDLDHRLKKEVELERVKALVREDRKKLRDYLNDNGHLELIEKMDQADFDIEKEITKIYDAKRLAALNEIKSKLGSRQISEAEAASGQKEAKIKENAQTSKEEHARLAQLVLFNNVITGNLSLKKTTGEELGRNVNVLKKETQGLSNAKIDPSLFENLKTNESEGGAQESLFENSSFLDQILGASSTNP